MTTDLLERRLRISGKNTLLLCDQPFAPVHGQDVWLYEGYGRKYLDVYNNVPNVGHCHPHVVAALCRQAGMLNLRAVAAVPVTAGQDLPRLVHTRSETQAAQELTPMLINMACDAARGYLSA